MAGLSFDGAVRLTDNEKHVLTGQSCPVKQTAVEGLLHYAGILDAGARLYATGIPPLTESIPITGQRVVSCASSALPLRAFGLVPVTGGRKTLAKRTISIIRSE